MNVWSNLLYSRSRRVSIPKVGSRVKLKHSLSREGLLREMEMAHPFVGLLR